MLTEVWLDINMGNEVSSYASEVIEKDYQDLLKSYDSDNALCKTSLDLESLGALEADTYSFHASSDLSSQKSREEKHQQSLDKAFKAEVSYAIEEGASHKKFKEMIDSLIQSLQDTAAAERTQNSLAKAWNSMIHIHRALLRQEALEAKKDSLEDSDEFYCQSHDLGTHFVVRSMMILLKQCAISDSGIGQEVQEMCTLLLEKANPGDLQGDDLKDVLDKANLILESLLGGESLSLRLKLALARLDLESLLHVALSLQMENAQVHKGYFEEFAKYMKKKCAGTLKFKANKPGVVVSNNSKTVKALGLSQQGNLIQTNLELSKGVFYCEFGITKQINSYMCLGILPSKSYPIFNSERIEFPICYQAEKSSYEKFSSEDSVGVYLNFITQKCSFYLNGSLQGTQDMPYTSVEIAFCLFNGESVTIKDSVEPPEKVSKEVSVLNDSQEELQVPQESGELCSFVIHHISEAANHYSELLSAATQIAPNFMPNPIIASPSKKVFDSIKILLLSEPNFSSKNVVHILSILRVNLLTVAKLRLNHQKMKLKSEEEKQNLLLGFFELLEKIRKTPDLPDETRKEALKCIADSFDLFYSSADQKLNYLIHILKDPQPSPDEVQIYNVILEKFSYTVATSQLLLNSSEEKVKEFQTELLKYIEGFHKDQKPEITKLYQAYQNSLLSHAARKSKEFFPGLLQGLVTAYLTYFNSLLQNSSEILEDISKASPAFEVVSLLFYSLPLINFERASLPSLFPLISQCQSNLNSFPLQKEDRIATSESKVIESAHPSPVKTTATEHIRSEHKILEANIEFSEECKLAEDSEILVVDRGAVLAKMKCEELRPFKVSNPKDLKVVINLGETECWGYKIAVSVTVERRGVLKRKISELKTSCSALALRLCELLIDIKPSETETSLLKNPIVSGGISDVIWTNFNCEKKLSEELKDLAKPMLRYEDEESPPPPTFSRSISVITDAKTKPLLQTTKSLDTLTEYFRNYESMPPFLYDQNFNLEALIDGKGSMGVIWNNLTKACRLDMSAAGKIGGQSAEKAERAVFAALLKTTSQDLRFENLSTSESEFPTKIKALRKQAHTIRKHLLKKKQEEANLEEEAEEVVNKCIIAMNSDYQETVGRMGISLQSLETPLRERRASLGEEIKEEFTPEPSKWKKVKKLTGALRKLKLLAGDKAQFQTESKDETEEQRVGNFLLEFVKGTTKVEDLAEEINQRREQAVSRVIGLDYMKVILQHTQDLSQFASVFSKVFDQNGVKVHFLEGLEGVDSKLKRCLSRSFFNLYRELLDRLLDYLEQEASWTVKDCRNTIFEVAGALAYPFRPEDAGFLLNIELHKPFGMFLDLAKGKIRTAKKRELELSKCICEFEFNEQGIEEDWIPVKEGLYFRPIYEKGEPITNAYFIEEPSPKALPQNFGDEHTPKFLVCEYEKSDKVLTKVTKDYEFEYSAVQKIYKKVQKDQKTLEEVQKLKTSAWNVLKLLFYCCTATPEASWERVSTASNPLTRIKETFFYIVFNEIASYNKNFILDEEPLNKAFLSLEIEEAINGKKWVNPQELRTTNLHIVEYLEHISAHKCQTVHKMLDNYLKWDIKHTGKAIPIQQIREIESSDQELEDFSPAWKNENGDFDLFKFLHSVKRDKDTDELSEDSKEFLRTCPLIEVLPETQETEHIEWPQEFANLGDFIGGVASRLQNSKLVDLLEMFRKAEPVGILDSESVLEILEEVDPAWLNNSGKLDFFCFINAVARPSASDLSKEFYSQLAEELKNSSYEMIPPSCEFVQNSRKELSDKVTSHFLRSLLWMLHTSLTSKSSKRLLSRQEFVKELHSLAFSYDNFQLTIYALKVLKCTILEGFSPESMTELLPSLNLQNITKYLGSEYPSENYLRLQFALASLCVSTEIKWEGEAMLSLGKRSALGLDAWDLASQLLKSKTWQSSCIQEFSATVQTLLEKLSSDEEVLNSKRTVLGCYHVIGGVLACLMPSCVEGILGEWNFVIRKAGGVGHEFSLRLESPLLFNKEQNQTETIEIDSIKQCVIPSPLKLTDLDPHNLHVLFEACSDLLRANLLLKERNFENTPSVLVHQTFLNTINHIVFSLLHSFSELKLELPKETVSKPMDFLVTQLVSETCNYAKEEKTLEILKKSYQNKIYEVKQEEKVEEEEKKETPEEDKKEVEINCLFKLDKEKAKSFTCYTLNENLDHVFNKLGHQAIFSEESIQNAYLEYQFKPSVFRNLIKKENCGIITMLLSIACWEDSGQIGFSIGDLSLVLFVDETVSARVYVDNHEIVLFEGASKSNNYEFRVHLHQNQNAEVIYKETSAAVTVKAVKGHIYSGFSIGDFKLHLKEGKGVILKGLSLYENKMETDLSYWQDCEILEEANYKDRIAVVKSQTKVDMNKMYLQCLGLKEDKVQELSEVSFLESLESLVKEDSPNYYLDSPEFKDFEAVTDVKIIDNLSELEPSYKVARIAREGKFVSPEDYSMKLLVFRTSPFREANKVLSAIQVSENSEVKNPYKLLGSLHIESESKDPLSSIAPVYVSVSWTKISQSLGSVISDIAIVESPSLKKVEVPLGYNLVYTVPSWNFNIGIPVFNLLETQEKLLCLAIKKNGNVFRGLGKHLALKREVEDNEEQGGMVDTLDNSQTLDQQDKQEISQLQTDIENMSTHEICCMLEECKLKLRAREAKTSIFSWAKIFPEVVSAYLQDKKVLSRIFLTCSGNYREITEVTRSILSDSSEKLSEILLHDMLLQSLASSLDLNPRTQMNNMLVESPHPYNNNMDVYETLSVPGASQLRLEFDTQTHTESGCDPLRFYRDEERKDLICEYSGENQNFKDFTVEGDTVFMWFHTDSSVVYWGYKFNVVPQGKFIPRLPVYHPLFKDLDVEHVIWLYENVLPSVNVPSHLQKFYSQKALNALILLAHNSSSSSVLIRTIKLLEKFFQAHKPTVELKPLEAKPEEFDRTKVLAKLQKPPEIQDYKDDFLEYFDKARDFVYQEARDLKKITGGNSSSSKFRAMCELMVGYNSEEPWIKKLNKSLKAIISFSQKNWELLKFLLEFYNQLRPQCLSIVEESSHPYPRERVSRLVQVKGASKLQVTADSKSKLEVGQAILLTKDPEAKQIINPVSSCSYTESTEFDPKQKAQYLTLSNNNSTVERTDSSGSWNATVSKHVIRKGKFKLRFKFEAIKEASDVIVGVNNYQNNYKLTTCPLPGNDFCKSFYSYRANGELNLGASTNIASANTGDTLTIEGNMYEKTLSFSLNDSNPTEGTITDEELLGHVCLGCRVGNKVTLEYLCSDQIRIDKLDSLQYLVESDYFYLHYPVDQGYLISHYFKFKDHPEVENGKQVYSSSDEPHIHITDQSIKEGTYYFEMLISQSGDSEMCVGIMPEDVDPAQVLSSPNCYVYYSSGKANLNCIQHSLPEFTSGDLISFLAAVDTKELVLYKNNQEVARGPLSVKNNKVQHYPSVLLSQKHQCVVLQHENMPQDFMWPSSGGVSKEWGVKLYVTPEFESCDNLSFLENLSDEELKQLDEFITRHLNISPETDRQLVRYIDNLSNAKNIDPVNLDVEEIKLTEEVRVKYKALETIDLSVFLERFKFILFLNETIYDGIQYINISIPEHKKLSQLLKSLIEVRGILFYYKKSKHLRDFLSATHGSARPEILIDKINAFIIKESGAKDEENKFSVFSQVMQQMNQKEGKEWRNSERVFHVNFKQEGATDAGGPYNETISHMCDELMSDFLPLFIPSPNAKHEVGQHRDCFLVNPEANSSKHLEMFCFLGKLFGAAIRTQNNLNLILPPLFWKKLCLQELQTIDLKDIDENTFQAVEMIRNPSASNLKESDVEAMIEDLNFTTRNSAGVSVELLQSGAYQKVTPENMKQYADLISEYRLHENDEAYLRIRQGMSLVIPLDFLNMFSWNHVESLVCGAPVIDIGRLKSNTQYEGYNEDDQTIKFFWEVLEEFNHEERTMFLRFVWGRSRLPAVGSFKNFTINRHHSANPDSYLPVSHTCFFSLDLPQYSSKEIVRRQLLYAISHCQAIDLDHDPGEEEE